MNGKILHNTDWWSFFSLKGLIWMYCWNLKRVTFCNVGFDYDVNDPICDWHPTIPYLVRSQKMAETILNSESSDSPGDILTCCLARLFIWKSKPYIKQAKKQKSCFKKWIFRRPFSTKTCGWYRDVCMDGASHRGHYCPISSLERIGACQVWGVCPLLMVCPAPRVFNRPGYNTTMCGKPLNTRQLKIAILDKAFFWLLIMQHI